MTLQDGTIDKGSKSFLDKETAEKFKEHCEKKEKLLKRTVFVNMPARLFQRQDEFYSIETPKDIARRSKRGFSKFLSCFLQSFPSGSFGAGPAREFVCYPEL